MLKSLKKEEAFLIGKLGKVKGLKGELRILLYADPDELPAKLASCYIQNGSFLIPYSIRALQLGQKGGVILFEELSSIEEAEKLVGKNVFIPLTLKKQLAFSYKDLESFEAEDEAHGKIGPIRRVDKYPQQWIAVIGAEKDEILIPLNEETVLEIKREQKSILVRLPEGLLELYKK